MIVSDMKRLILVLALLVVGASAQAAPVENGCWFMRTASPDAPKIAIPQQLKSVTIAGYFHIYYAASDAAFADALAKQQSVIERSKQFLENELAWRLPATRTEMNQPQLDVYFVQASRRFTGTVASDHDLSIILNRSVLSTRDFPSIWIHEFAHASELQYRKSGDYWFFEATAAWMETVFSHNSHQTEMARAWSQSHASTSLISNDAVSALGASRFLELLSRPYRDLIRQIWDQWSYSNDTESLVDIVARTLALNHSPDLESYLQNYYLAAKPEFSIHSDSQSVLLQPYSAAILRGMPDQNSGGSHLSFVPNGPSKYSASLLFYARGETSGTAALKKGLTDVWSVIVPYAAMDHYDFIVVNSSSVPLRGKVVRNFDSSIPGVLEYFRVNPGDGGVQIEWKTAKEDGVAFWNLYRIERGSKVLLNEFPIPASIDSQEGVHYLYFDNSDGAFYSLEAITSDGFASPFAASDTPK